MAGLVVLTDLDGTLLDHRTYAWEPAREALEALARRGAVVAIASSKTRVEIEVWRARLGLRGPFISENGGALYVPRDAPVGPLAGEEPAPGYRRVVFGARYQRLRQALAELAAELGVPLRGFGDMSVPEIARLTDLREEDARLAAQREYDEPFVADRALAPDEAGRLAELAAARGLRTVRGGRLWHLIGASSKGRAARTLLGGYAAAGPPPATLGLGDGPNDLELLREVGRAVVVARPDGTHAPELVAALPQAHLTHEPGPRGFAEGVMAYLGASG